VLSLIRAVAWLAGHDVQVGGQQLLLGLDLLLTLTL
jgi:hypothetical protein